MSCPSLFAALTPAQLAAIRPNHPWYRAVQEFLNRRPAPAVSTSRDLAVREIEARISAPLKPAPNPSPGRASPKAKFRDLAEITAERWSVQSSAETALGAQLISWSQVETMINGNISPHDRRNIPPEVRFARTRYARLALDAPERQSTIFPRPGSVLSGRLRFRHRYRGHQLCAR